MSETRRVSLSILSKEGILLRHFIAKIRELLLQARTDVGREEDFKSFLEGWLAQRGIPVSLVNWLSSVGSGSASESDRCIYLIDRFKLRGLSDSCKSEALPNR